MARPNNTDAIQAKIQGMRELKAAFQALPEITRDALNVATETTAKEIVRAAKGRIQSSPSIRTRSLLNHIGYSMSPKTGRARVGVSSGSTTMVIGGKKVKVKGIIKLGRGLSAKTSAGATKIVPSKYAKFVEFGTVRMPAEPFMIPSANDQKQPYLSRCQAAGKKIEQGAAAIGSRNL